MGARYWFRALLWTLLPVVMLATGSRTPVVAASPGQGPVGWTDIQGSDDFLFDPSVPLDPLLAAIDCVNGDPTGNPLQPCSPGSRIRIRELPALSMMSSSDPRFGGLAVVVANANFDPQYAGQVWGRWSLVVGTGEGLWEGTWQGTRTRQPGGGPAGGDAWTTQIHFVGLGSGSVEGLHVSASETVVTFTPLPIPYEALGFCTPGSCPAEGAIVGRLYGSRGRSGGAGVR